MKVSSIALKFIGFVSGVYFGVLLLVFAFLHVTDNLSAETVWDGLVYPGLGFLIPGFLLLGVNSDRWGGISRTRRMQSDVYFKKWHKGEKPIELVAWGMILIGGLLMLTGFYLAKYI